MKQAIFLLASANELGPQTQLTQYFKTEMTTRFRSIRRAVICIARPTKHNLAIEINLVHIQFGSLFGQ